MRGDLLNHITLFLDGSCRQTIHTRDKAWVPNHVGRQLSWVAADGVKLQARVAYKLGECVMGCETDAMAVSLELITESDEWLYVSPASDNLNDDVELRGP